MQVGELDHHLNARAHHESDVVNIVHLEIAAREELTSSQQSERCGIAIRTFLPNGSVPGFFE